MRHISGTLSFVLFITFFLVACSGPAKDEDFSTVYKKHISRVFDELIGFKNTLSFEGTERDLIRIIGRMGTEIGFEANTIVEAKKNKENYAVDFSLTGSARFSEDFLTLKALSWSAIFIEDSMYGKLNSLSITGSILDPIFLKNLPIIQSKMIGKWLSLTKKEFQSLTVQEGVTGSSALLDDISKQIKSANLEDIRESFLSYPIFSVLKDQWIQEDAYVYEVQLDKNSITSLIQDITGKIVWLSASKETEEAINSALSMVDIQWILRIQTKDSLYGSFVGKVTESMEGKSINVTLLYSPTLFQVVLWDTQDGINISFDRSVEGKYVFHWILQADGLNIITIDTVATTEKGRLTDITSKAEGTIQWNFTYHRNNDGSFLWEWVVWIAWQNAKIHFDGLSEDFVLKRFGCSIELPEENGIKLLLEPKENNWVTGVLLMQGGWQNMEMATIGLRTGKNLFGLKVDVSNPIVSKEAIYIEVEWSMNRSKEVSMIIPPKEFVPFISFMNDTFWTWALESIKSE